MDYIALEKGKRVIINAGTHTIDAVVDHVDGMLVCPVNHKEFLRGDCYAVPEEMDRLIFDSRLYADSVESIAEQIKAGQR